LLNNNIKFAVTFGNHDDESTAPSKTTQYNYYKSRGGNLFVDHVCGGVNRCRERGDADLSVRTNERHTGISCVFDGFRHLRFHRIRKPANGSGRLLYSKNPCVSDGSFDMVSTHNCTGGIHASV
jgi:hypothetical protein